MNKQGMIKEILKITPTNLVLRGGTKEIYDFHPMLKIFGEYHSGIGDKWMWFTRDKINHELQVGHKFLDDASTTELEELLSLIKTSVNEKQEA